MVRLVFRPYTQVGRPICTSGPLRASTRVSSGFALPGHSSPSFGSHRARSRSTCPTERDKTGRRCARERSRLSRPPGPASAFTAPRGVARDSLRLARALDSLVRVSRRVGWVAEVRRGPLAARRTGGAAYGVLSPSAPRAGDGAGGGRPPGRCPWPCRRSGPGPPPAPGRCKARPRGRGTFARGRPAPIRGRSRRSAAEGRRPGAGGRRRRAAA